MYVYLGIYYIERMVEKGWGGRGRIRCGIIMRSIIKEI